MTGVIDRFEGSFVIIELENKQIINIERKNIPSEAKEGYVLNIDDIITINFRETKNREKFITKLTEDMWK